jgi:hypothetical protein
MPTIIADHDVERQLEVLLRLWLSRDWRELWASVACDIESFEQLGIDESSPDAEVWQLCQDRRIVLITGTEMQ